MRKKKSVGVSAQGNKSVEERSNNTIQWLLLLLLLWCRKTTCSATFWETQCAEQNTKAQRIFVYANVIMAAETGFIRVYPLEPQISVLTFLESVQQLWGRVIQSYSCRCHWMLVGVYEEEGQVSYGWTSSSRSLQCSYFQFHFHVDILIFLYFKRTFRQHLANACWGVCEVESFSCNKKLNR